MAPFGLPVGPQPISVGTRPIGETDHAIFILRGSSHAEGLILKIPYDERCPFEAKDELQRLIDSELSPLQKLREAQQIITRYDLSHTVLFNLNGTTLTCELKDLPTDLPENLFNESVCGLTGFSLYANQYKPITPELSRPQFRIICDGAGFGEINALNLPVPDAYKNCGYINEDNFVDIYLQVASRAVRNAVATNLEEQGTGVPLCPFKGYRGGDEMAFVIFKDSFEDPRKVVNDILHAAEEARIALFKALPDEYMEQLDKAGHALRFRSILGQIFLNLESIRELDSPDPTDPAYKISSVAGGLYRIITKGAEDGAILMPEAARRTLIKALKNAEKEEEIVEALGSLFYFAAQAQEPLSRMGSDNFALKLNHAVLDLDTLCSTAELGAHIHLAEQQIDEQKLTRHQASSSIKHHRPNYCPRSALDIITRLEAEETELLQIQETRRNLGETATPMEIAGLYDQLMAKVCGDTGVPGTIRTSVTRAMTFRELMRLDEPLEVYVTGRTLQGMRVLNHLYGMNEADSLVASMAGKFSAFNHPMIMLKHMGDTIYGIYAHKPNSVSLDESAQMVQEAIDEKLLQNDDGIIYAAYKFAGKMLVSQYLKGVKASFQATGKISDIQFSPLETEEDSRIIRMTIHPEQTVAEFLGELNRNMHR